MSAIDTGLALLGGIVKAFTTPQVDAVIDIVVEALQGVDDIIRNATDGDWSAEDEGALEDALFENFSAVRGLDDDKRAEALANGLAAGLSLLIEAALERRKEGPPVRKVGTFFAERKAVRTPDNDTQRYALTGTQPFRAGIHAAVWDALGEPSWNRQFLLAVVNDIISSGQFENIRSPETICRDFLGRVQEKGRLQRL